MRSASNALFLTLASLAALVRSGVPVHRTPAPPPARVRKELAAVTRLPLVFEESRREAAAGGAFVARSRGSAVELRGNGMAFWVPTGSPRNGVAEGAARVEMRLVGTRKGLQPKGRRKLPGRANYFIGSDPRKWRRDVSLYGAVAYEDAYPGVNLVCYGSPTGNGEQLEYDFRVRPGADPGAIRMRFAGVGQARVDAGGDLLLRTPGAELRQHRPVVYQELDGERRAVEGGFVVAGADPAARSADVTFRVGKYDPTRTLVIDPTLSYSSYFGGDNSITGTFGQEWGTSVAVDSSGAVYLGGITGSANLPVTSGAYDVSLGPASDVFVAKFDLTKSGGAALVYCTYLGGTFDLVGSPPTELAGSGDECHLNRIADLAVDSAGAVFVTGQTHSHSFPTTPGAIKASLGNSGQAGHGYTGDAWLAKLTPSGNNLAYSTLLGGDGEEDHSGYPVARMAIDPAGNAYVVGETQSTDNSFPTTTNAYRQAFQGGAWDGFLAKVNPTGTALLYSTYLGGTGTDRAYDVAVDASGVAVVVGETNSNSGFPLRNALQGYGGAGDAFITRIDTLKSGDASLLSSTYLGGGGSDLGMSVALDESGAAYVGGTTQSAGLGTAGTVQPLYQGGWDGFVARFRFAPLQRDFFTYFGGAGGDYLNALAVHPSGNVYVAGGTTSSDFPRINAIQSNPAGSQKAFAAKIDLSGASTGYSTCFGGTTFDEAEGIAVDASGNALVAANTQSADAPTTSNAYKSTYGRYQDALFLRLTVSGPPTGCTATAQTSRSISIQWTYAPNDASAFLVERRAGSGAFAVVVNNLAKSARQYTDTGLSTKVIYTYRVRARTADGYSVASNEAASATLPNPPASLTATPASTTQINLAWTDASDNETQFLLERKGPSDASFMLIVATSGTTFDDTGRTPNTTYQYRVQAENASGRSAYSNTAGATTPQDPVKAASSLRVTGVTQTTAGLAWNDNSTDEIQFKLERKLGASGTYAQIATPAANTTAYTDTGLTANTDYFYRLRTSFAGGDSAYTSPDTPATTLPDPPAAPTGLSVTVPSAPTGINSLDLAWTDNSGDETGFKIQRKTGTDPGTPFTTVTTAAAGATSYRDGALAPNTSYTYQVLATNTGGDSAPSNLASGTTLPDPSGAPSNLRVTGVTQTTVSLAWNDNSTDELQFKLERRQGAGGTYAQIATPAANTTAYTDTGLTPDTTYYYRIRASFTGGDSPYTSPDVPATTLPDPPVSPSMLAVTAPAAPTGINSLDLAWSDNSSNETGFKIERKVGTNPSTPFGSVTTTSAGVTTYRDTGLAAGTTYTYRVIATNTGGDSPPSNEAGATTLPNPPTAPADLVVSAPPPPKGIDSLDLLWQDTSSNEAGFRIERKTGVDPLTPFAAVAAVAAGSTSYRDSGLSSGTVYTYRVVAFNAGGDSAPSNTAAAGTLPDPPAAPTDLTVTVPPAPDGIHALDLAWSDNSSSETSFKIQRKTGSDPVFVDLATVAADMTSYHDSGLAPNTTFTYQVIANNAGGDSGPSNPASGTTLPNPPNAPSSLRVTAMTDTTVSLAWTDNSSNEDRFELERTRGAGVTVLAVPAEAIACSDTGLSPNTFYRYRLRAVNAGGASDWAGPVSATTRPDDARAPSNLRVTAFTSSTVDLAWDDNSPDELRFRLERSEGPAGSFAEIATPGANAASYRDTTVAPNTSYIYRIRASFAGGESPYSNEAPVTTPANPPTAPANLRVTDYSSVSVSLAWTVTSINEERFELERTQGSTVTLRNLPPRTSSFTDSGLTPVTTYTYRLRAANAGGSSSWDGPVTATTLPNPPAAPSPLTAAPVSSDTIRLAWRDNAVNETGFKIERKTGSEAWAEIAARGANVTGHDDSDRLKPGTLYTYRVRAVNSGGLSGYSNEASAATGFAPGGVLVVASNLNFGRGPVGRAIRKGLTIRNASSVEVLGVVVGPLSAPFSLSGPSSFTIPPRTSISVPLTFLPSARTTFTRRLVITSSDPLKPRVEVTLRGAGK